MRVRPPLPESYLAVSMRSMQTPLKGPHRQVCPALKLPTRLLDGWGVEPGEGSVFTSDHGPVTLISPNNLPGAKVLRRRVQASGLVTLPPDLGRAHAGPSEATATVGIVDWSGEDVALITSPSRIARQLGSLSLTEVGSADRERLAEFALEVLACRLRHEVVLDGAGLQAPPAELAPLIFPELSATA